MANNLAEGNEFAARMIKYKKSLDFYSKDADLLGMGWWRGFRKQNKDIVESKVSQKFACLRADVTSNISF